MHENFKFVLARATGELFMWAADDDEWQPTFVEKCLENIGPAASVVSGCELFFRFSERREAVALPKLDARDGTYNNLKRFLGSMEPGFFYGVHRRQSLQWVLSTTPFDWFDAYFAARQIANGGFTTFPEILLTIGIDAASYEFKPFAPRKGALFRYIPFLSAVTSLIIQSSDLSFRQKLILFHITTDYMADAFLRFEAKLRPRQARLVKVLRSLKRRVVTFR